MTTYHHILLVEDDTDDSDFFLDVLHDIDPTVSCLVAKNGPEALEMLKTFPRFRSILFLDLNLPMMSGMELLEVIKAEKDYKNIPVVILTTSTSHTDACRKLGANLYVTKPRSVDLLHTVLSVILTNDVMKDEAFVQELITTKFSQAE
jgi:CheY-like chemotaxis protein